MAALRSRFAPLYSENLKLKMDNEALLDLLRENEKLTAANKQLKGEVTALEDETVKLRQVNKHQAARIRRLETSHEREETGEESKSATAPQLGWAHAQARLGDLVSSWQRQTE